jgi:hypothetical protein
MATDMNWELAEFSLDRESRSARYAFRHQGGHGTAADEHVAIQVRVFNHQGESDEHLRNLANQRLIQVLNEIEMALVG